MPYSIHKTPKSREAIKAILYKISAEHPETYISSKLGVSAFAVRNWIARGIPMKFWDKIAKMASLPREAIEAAHVITREK